MEVNVKKHQKPSVLIYGKTYDAFFYDVNSDCKVKFVDNSYDAYQSIAKDFTELVILDFDYLDAEGKAFYDNLRKLWNWLPCIFAGSDDTLTTSNIFRDISGLYILNKTKFSSEQTLLTIHEIVDKSYNIFANNIKNNNLSHELFKKYNELVYITIRSFRKAIYPNSLLDLAEIISLKFPQTISGVLYMEGTKHFLSAYSRNQYMEKHYTLIHETLQKYYNLLNNEAIDVSSIKLKETIHDKEAKLDIDAEIYLLPVLIENHISSFLFIACSPEPEMENLLKQYTKFLYETLHVTNDFRNRIIHDKLTGLYNHAYLYTKLKECWRNAIYNASSMGFMMLDIDRFKNLNDSYGHRTGDALINEFGRIVKTSVGENGIVARYGGDEIAVILPESTSVQAQEIADNLLKSINEHIFKDSGHPLRLTASIGYATSDTTPINNEIDLLELADKALYLAKKSGRNQSLDAISNQEKSMSLDKSLQNSSDISDFSPDKNDITPNGKVLLVDDDTQIIELLKRLLETCNYEVITQNRPFDALNYVRENAVSIDVIISDINMPGMSGIELVHEVKNIDPNIVIIIISGYASSENTIAALRAGVFNFIQKPFNIQDVRMTVTRAIEQRRLRRQLEMYHIHTEELLQHRTKALQDAVDDLKHSYMKTMEAIVGTLDIHEESAALHSERVSKLSVILAKQLGVTEPSFNNHIQINRKQLEGGIFKALFKLRNFYFRFFISPFTDETICAFCWK